MTIDEAIKHCEEVANQNEFETRIYDELNRASDEEYRNNHCQCAADHRQLAAWLKELKEAKKLLKLAVEDMKNVDFCSEVCCRDSFACRVSDTCDFKWRYADEAEKLSKE